MKTDILIIGQGVCGTFLHWYLTRSGISAVVIDEYRASSASMSAAGVINPVTGRRLVKTWMIDELLPFALGAYRSVEQELGAQLITEKDTVDFFPTVQMRLAYQDRFFENADYLAALKEDDKWADYFHYVYGYGQIHPCYLIDLKSLLTRYRNQLEARGQLMEERFNLADCKISESHVAYKGIEAGRIIFCDGIESSRNPYFRLLPFAPNKGEALLLEIAELPATNIYKKGISLIPFGDHIFWAGSSYEWEFKDELPSETFRDRMESALRGWLKSPFKILEHIASIRPATLERRPFVGWHPVVSRIGILNGMGTKGASLAPYFASQLANQILGKETVRPEADLARFSRLLQRVARS